jgi:hypothetical protein
LKLQVDHNYRNLLVSAEFEEAAEERSGLHSFGPHPAWQFLSQRCRGPAGHAVQFGIGRSRSNRTPHPDPRKPDLVLRFVVRVVSEMAFETVEIRGKIFKFLLVPCV